MHVNRQFIKNYWRLAMALFVPLLIVGGARAHTLIQQSNYFSRIPTVAQEDGTAQMKLLGYAAAVPAPRKSCYVYEYHDSGEWGESEPPHKQLRCVVYITASWQTKLNSAQARTLLFHNFSAAAAAQGFPPDKDSMHYDLKDGNSDYYPPNNRNDCIMRAAYTLNDLIGTTGGGANSIGTLSYHLSCDRAARNVPAGYTFVGTEPKWE